MSVIRFNIPTSPRRDNFLGSFSRSKTYKSPRIRLGNEEEEIIKKISQQQKIIKKVSSELFEIFKDLKVYLQDQNVESIVKRTLNQDMDEMEKKSKEDIIGFTKKIKKLLNFLFMDKKIEHIALKKYDELEKANEDVDDYFFMIEKLENDVGSLQKVGKKTNIFLENN